eukprot:CAMPEP_0202700394 /NCGR_PEP_ID=MMETSP1385-20130828/13574_1 /ASSEMBLY_ACC=CAM_ASM_000861 /TAXON_ID=933848 /ORGANISM="Elphidium margaritaceum" /LENGTH=186 /DNA_ID=CAMNT_0049357567 /DNA_START=13 /DNA_END=570 /DNA_ORIENTATION=-
MTSTIDNHGSNSKHKNLHDYHSHYDMEHAHMHSWTVCEYILLFLAWIIVIVIPVFWFCIFRTVRDYQRAIIFRLGKSGRREAGPGVFALNPLTDVIKVIDLRIETCNLEPQSMMSKDTVTVTVDAVCFMKVIDPIKAVLEIDNYRTAFINFSATTLRSVIGTYDLQALLSERDEINKKIQRIIEDE